jgi:hypothetical protein
MGQQVSKRVVMPKLKDATKAYESEVAKDVMNDIARKKIIAKAKGQKYIDPTAQTGFKRDTWHQNEGSPMESHQRNFLKDQQGTHEEMPKVSSVLYYIVLFVLLFLCLFLYCLLFFIFHSRFMININ